MTEEQINYIKKLINDIRVYSDDTLHIIDNYYVKTGLHLPLISLLRDLKMDAKVQDNENLVLKISNMRDDVATYLHWRIDQADKQVTRVLADLINVSNEIPGTEEALRVAENILGFWVTIRILAKNDYYEVGNFITNEIKKLFEIFNQNKSVLPEATQRQMMALNDQLTQLNVLFQQKDTQQIMRLTRLIRPAVSD